MLLSLPKTAISRHRWRKSVHLRPLTHSQPRENTLEWMPSPPTREDRPSEDRPMPTDRRRTRPACAHCGTPLRVSQPSEEDYIRLLAICPAEGCGRWYLRLEPPGGRALTIPLEEVPTLAGLGVRPEGVPSEADARAARRALTIVPA